MQKKIHHVVVKGINRDSSVNSYPNGYVYNLKNVRLITDTSLSRLCIQNEKGNSKLDIEGITGTLTNIYGVQELNDYIIIFAKENIEGKSYDCIYRVKEINAVLLFRGNLNFNKPIESIGIYETENIQKVYWIDGINQPRVINIVNRNNIQKDSSKVYDGFDFVSTLDSNIDVTIEKLKTGGSGLSAGTLQYAISYFDLYGKQTGIIYQSPMLYATSSENRGLDSETTSVNAFKLFITNPSNKFEYFRVYRISYTSIDATPSVEIIGDYLAKDNKADLQIEGELTVETTPESITYDIKAENQLVSSAFIENSDRFKLVSSDGGIYSYVIDNSSYVTEDNRKETIIKYLSNDTEYKIVIPKDKSVMLQSLDNTLTTNSKMTIGIVSKGTDNTWRYDNTKLDIYKILNNTAIVIDNGTTGNTVDPTELLYLGGEPIIPKAITYKDNTLFLGNIALKRKSFTTRDVDYVRNNSKVYFDYKDVEEDYPESANTPYDYNFNLDNSNSYFSYFQYGETYRVGVIFLHNTGVWSEVIWLKDYKNDKRVIPNKVNSTINKKPIIKAHISIPGSEYIAARLVCVYPKDNEREIVCQGIVLPTLYNLGDRLENKPYVQSDWFSRPEYYGTQTSFNNYSSNGNMVKYREDFKGVPIEYRMVKGGTEEDPLQITGGLPNTENYNAEVCYSTGKALFAVSKEHTKAARIEESGSHLVSFGVDKRILTFHSPELDTNYNDNLINTEDLKFRVVGYAPLKNNISYMKLESQNPFNPYISDFYYTQLEDNAVYKGIANLGNMGLISFPYWVDNLVFNKDETTPQPTNTHQFIFVAFPIYPWHKSGSLNNQGQLTDASNRKSKLKSKSLSTLRVALSTRYSDSIDLPTSNIEIFNSDNIVVSKLNIWGKTLNYYGNIDTIITPEEPFPKHVAGWYPSVKYENIEYDGSIVSAVDLTKKDSHFISTDDRGPGGYYFNLADNTNRFKIATENKVSTEGIGIKYKSTRHAVFALDRNEKNEFMLLPKFYNSTADSSTLVESESWVNSDSSFNLIWQDENDEFKGFKQPILLVDPEENSSFKYYYIIGEFYREIINKFGGTSTSALMSNTWNICGDTVYFNSNADTVDLIGDRGDTYYMRYDNLKTYPYTFEDINQICDIVSFCCETRINIDGRYDRNRGLQDNTAISPTNFNLYNPVYSQINSILYTSKYMDYAKISSSSYPSLITWSKTKTLGEDIDTWTNFTLVSTLDLDGDKGEIVSLNRFNNEIYSFQPKGISRVLFNPRVQINSSDGVPIEISNSGKVEGKIYLSDKYGCSNKWSIVESGLGIYFIDTDTSDLFVLNNGINNVSLSKGLHSWFKQKDSTLTWDFDSNTIRTLYDKVNREVLLITNEECLAFNENLMEFTSFYSYPNIRFLYNYSGDTFQVMDSSIWKLHGGDYNTIFNNPYNYEISFINNSDLNQDKIFDSIEFTSSDTPTFSNSGKNKVASYYPFYSLEAENEYQQSISDTSKLKKKFRIWRWSVGRNILGKVGDKVNRDRIRNTWAKFNLKGNLTSSVKIYNIDSVYYI